MKKLLVLLGVIVSSNVVASSVSLSVVKTPDQLIPWYGVNSLENIGYDPVTGASYYGMVSYTITNNHTNNIVGLAFPYLKIAVSSSYTPGFSYVSNYSTCFAYTESKPMPTNESCILTIKYQPVVPAVSGVLPFSASALAETGTDGVYTGVISEVVDIPFSHK